MRKILLSIISVFISLYCFSQNNYRKDETILVPTENYFSLNPLAPSSAYLSNAIFDKTECISNDEIEFVQKQIEENIAALKMKNPNVLKKTSTVHPLFIWPVQAKAGFADYGYFTVQNLFDHNNTYNNLLDYNCGNRTYDWSTGNHAGTDIILWPYAWRRMDEQVMEVIAAAPGVIVNKVDGNYDRSCINNGGGTWNSIYVQHSDGSVAWYLHFKNGSLTTKSIGDSVSLGEYLGTAGSSGSSSWPHLHFQVMDNNGALIDPWDGTCNSINAGDTWWQNQIPYDVPSVNRICTKNSEVDYYVCPNPEITFERDTFNIGDSLWLWLYTRDLQLNSNMQLNIYNPSNQNVITFPFTVPWVTNPTSYVRWYYVVDSWWTQGWWKFEVVYNGITYEHMFYMSHSITGYSNNESKSLFSISPNPAIDEIRLTSLSESVSLNVVDAIGKSVYTASLSNGNYKINTSNWSNGVYLFQLKSDKSSTNQKIIIQH